MIYISTGNKSKLADITRFFSWINPDIVVDQVPDYVDVEETGNTLAQNSKLKVLPYIDKYKFPVIANDAGQLFDKDIPEIQDPVKVKRNALGNDSEYSLSQEDIAKRMIDYYCNIAKKYGGKIKCQMNDVFSILLPDGTIKQEETVREYILVDRVPKEYDIYHPLNSIRISPRTNKVMDDMNEDEEKIDKYVLVEALRKLIIKFQQTVY